MVYVASLSWTYNSDSKPINSCDLIMFMWPLLFKKETRNIRKTLVLVDSIFLPKFIKMTKHNWKQQ